MGDRLRIPGDSGEYGGNGEPPPPGYGLEGGPRGDGFHMKHWEQRNGPPAPMRSWKQSVQKGRPQSTHPDNPEAVPTRRLHRTHATGPAAVLVPVSGERGRP